MPQGSDNSWPSAGMQILEEAVTAMLVTPVAEGYSVSVVLCGPHKIQVH